MTFPPPTLQPRVAAIAPLRRQGERLLGRLLRRTRVVVVPRSELNGGDPVLEVGRRLRGARESRGISLRQLAQETRISITVLEALERGWRDRLPEAAYLGTMLTLLEQHLVLERGSLQAALPPRAPRSLRSSLKAHSRRVSFTSIEQFASWQGTALYALLCLLLIYALNRQQQRLVLQGLLPQRPVAARPSPPSEAARSQDRDRERVLAAYPDLRPLERARQGRGLALLRSIAPAAASAPPGQPSSSQRQAGAVARPSAAAPGPGSPGAVESVEASQGAQDPAASAPRP